MFLGLQQAAFPVLILIMLLTVAHGESNYYRFVILWIIFPVVMQKMFCLSLLRLLWQFFMIAAGRYVL